MKKYIIQVGDVAIGNIGITEAIVNAFTVANREKRRLINDHLGELIFKEAIKQFKNEKIQDH